MNTRTACEVFGCENEATTLDLDGETNLCAGCRAAAEYAEKEQKARLRKMAEDLRNGIDPGLIL